MRLSSNSAIIAVSLAHVGCFQQSFNQLSISDSQASDSIQTSSDPTGVSTASSTTGSVYSGGISQTGNTSDAGTSMPMGETIETMTGLTAHGSSTSETTTDTTSAGATTGQEGECTDAAPLLLNGECYALNDVRLVFVTAGVFQGSMDSPDKMCANAANGKLAYPENFEAWATLGNEPPADRFDTSFAGPYVKLNPEDDPNVDSDAVVLVAMGWTGLTTKELLSAIDVTETGIAITEGYAWTAVKMNGSTSKLHNCGEWSSSNSEELLWPICEEKVSDYGSVGKVGDTLSSWSYTPEFGCNDTPPCCHGLKLWGSWTVECDKAHHLYCIQDK